MASRHVCTLTLLALLACARQARNSAARRFDPPTNYFDSVLVQQTAAAGISYSEAYDQALRKAPSGLSRVLAATTHTDGVAAATHDQIVWDLLQAWGDSAFAAVLQAQPAEVRVAVRCS